MRSDRLVLARELVIPAGTVFDAPPRSRATSGEQREAVVAIGKDAVAHLTFDLSYLNDTLQWWEGT